MCRTDIQLWFMLAQQDPHLRTLLDGSTPPVHLGPLLPAGLSTSAPPSFSGCDHSLSRPSSCASPNSSTSLEDYLKFHHSPQQTPRCTWTEIFIPWRTHKGFYNLNILSPVAPAPAAPTTKTITNSNKRNNPHSNNLNLSPRPLPTSPFIPANVRPLFNGTSISQVDITFPWKFFGELCSIQRSLVFRSVRKPSDTCCPSRPSPRGNFPSFLKLCEWKRKIVICPPSDCRCNCCVLWWWWYYYFIFVIASDFIAFPSLNDHVSLLSDTLLASNSGLPTSLWSCLLAGE